VGGVPVPLADAGDKILRLLLRGDRAAARVDRFKRRFGMNEEK